jgi:hypothetical protein
MAKYQRVSPKFWQDPKVRRWPDQQKLLASYLQTCPHRTTEGLFWLPHGYVAQDLGWGIDRVSEGYSGLIGAGFAAYDDTTETVLLRDALRDDAPVGPKQIQGAITRLADVPPSPLFAQLRDAAARYAPDFAKALDAAFESGDLMHHRYPIDTPSEGYRSPIDSSSSNSSSNSSSAYGGAATAASELDPVKAEVIDAEVIEDESASQEENAQTVLASYIDWRREQGINSLDNRTKGQLAKQLGIAFDAGHQPDVIKRGLWDWHHSGQHPSTLLSFIDAVARRGSSNGHRSDRQRLADASVQELLTPGGGA